MSNPLPAEIQVIELADGVCYRLSGRDRIALRSIGASFVGFGLLGAMEAVAVVLIDPFEAGPLICGLSGAFFLITVYRYRSILARRGEIEIKTKWLTRVNLAGPMRWVQRRKTASVRRFVVVRGRLFTSGKPITTGQLATVASIWVECEGADDMLLAVGFPLEMLSRLSVELAKQWQLRTKAISPSPTVTVVETPVTEPERFIERDEQPAGSRILCTQSDNGVTLTVPPTWSGSAGEVFGALIWCSAIAWIAWTQMDGELIPLFVMSVFFLVGAGSILGVVRRGRRWTILAVVTDRLMVIETGFFGSRRSEWRHNELIDVRPGHTDFWINYGYELQIHLPNGEKFRMLAGRDRAELEWLATVLRRSLRPKAASIRSHPLTAVRRIEANYCSGSGGGCAP